MSNLYKKNDVVRFRNSRPGVEWTVINVIKAGDSVFSRYAYDLESRKGAFHPLAQEYELELVSSAEPAPKEASSTPQATTPILKTVMPPAEYPIGIALKGNLHAAKLVSSKKEAEGFAILVSKQYGWGGSQSYQVLYRAKNSDSWHQTTISHNNWKAGDFVPCKIILDSTN